MQRISIVNKSTSVSMQDAAKWIAAIQRQLVGDFAPVWNESAVLHLANPDERLDSTDWIMNLVDKSGTDGALGSHWTEGQRPTGEVGVQTCVDDGVAPSSCLSHEILEMVGDALAIQAMQVGSSFYAFEACDPVEASDTDYAIDGVPLENFVYPVTFMPGSSGPWDLRGKLSKPLEVLPQGYQLICDASGNWTQQTGSHARKSKCVAGETSRRAMRMRRAGYDPRNMAVVPA